MRSMPPLILATGLLLFLVPGRVRAGKTDEPRAKAPPAEVLAELPFETRLGWYYQNDVGMLLAYGDGRLRMIDLLASEPSLRATLDVPDLSAPESVVPIAGTGLLLVPRAAGREGGESSYAIDTLGGRILWKNDPLPAPNIVFAYPDAGLAVIRSFEAEGHVLALDLTTGRRVWDLAERATIIWVTGRHVRFLSGSNLVTVDVRTGEILRREAMEIPPKVRLYALKHENVILFWKNKHIDGYSLPPAPPAPAAPARKLWSFDAAGPMLNLCIKGGGCDINRVGEDLLMVDSARHHELVRLTTGERVLHVKYGMFPAPVLVSPNDRRAAVAARDRLEFYDLASGQLLHAVEYPKGDEGLKTMKYLRWLGDDAVMVVYPDKKGNPRKMSAFSADDGKLAWTFVLPEVADYALTAEQRGKLIGRITLALVATAVSASNPMSIGGTSYNAIFIPNLDVGQTLDAGGAVGRGTAGEVTGERRIFDEAMKRQARIIERTDDGPRRTYFVVGDHGSYEVLDIDLQSGEVERAVRYQADKVHSIAPLTTFGVAVTVEDNNRRLRLIALEPKGAGS